MSNFSISSILNLKNSTNKNKISSTDSDDYNNEYKTQNLERHLLQKIASGQKATDGSNSSTHPSLYEASLHQNFYSQNEVVNNDYNPSENLNHNYATSNSERSSSFPSIVIRPALSNLLDAFTQTAKGFDLDSLVILMIALYSGTSDSEERLATQLKKIQTFSNNLKEASDAFQELSDYIKANPDQAGKKLNLNNLPSLTKALNDFGSYANGTISASEAMYNMKVTLEDNMKTIDPNTSFDTFETDFGKFYTANGNSAPAPTDLVFANTTDNAYSNDINNQLTNSANAATNISATNSATLQALANNAQMQLSMISSCLERMNQLMSMIARNFAG